MDDKFITALITVGGMLGVVICNEVFAWLRERRNRAKTFFKDFFPERLQAHKEILRVITESGIESLDPEPSNIARVQEMLEKAAERMDAVCLHNRLFMDEDVFWALAALSVNTRIAKDKIEEPVDPVSQFIDAVDTLQGQYNNLVELLREKSGIDIIDQEFAKVVKRRKKLLAKKKQGLQKDAQHEA
jgi:hypothetical protein